MKKTKSSKKELPDKLIPIICSDKEGWTESWDKKRNLLNIVHPFRLGAFGPPSSGKSTAIKNIIVRAKPKFQEIIVCHLDENSTEWKDCDAKMIKEIPEPTSFDRTKKKLLILEDLNLSDMSKIDKNKLNRLMGYASSHCNLSICITAQNSFDLSASIRRMCSLFVIFKQPDLNSLITLSSRTGLKSSHMLFIMSRLLNECHDSLWIDLSLSSPARYRINGFDKITLEDLDTLVKELL
jgi:hypothetical protein